VAMDTYRELLLIEALNILKQRAKVSSYYFDKESRKLHIMIEKNNCSLFPFPKTIVCESTPIPMQKILNAVTDPDLKKLKTIIRNRSTLNIYTLDYYPSSEPALYLSLIYHKINAAKVLLDAHADMYAMDSRYSFDPVSYAATIGEKDLPFTRLFLQYGAEPNHRNARGVSWLRYAVYTCKNFKTVDLLLRHGADPDAKDVYGTSVRDDLSKYCKNKKGFAKMKKLFKKKKVSK